MTTQIYHLSNLFLGNDGWEEQSKLSLGPNFYYRLKEDGMDFSLFLKNVKVKTEKNKKEIRWHANLSVWIVDKKRYQKEHGKEYMDFHGYCCGGSGEGKTKKEAKWEALYDYQSSRWF